MTRYTRYALLAVAMLLLKGMATAQAVEAYAGHERAGIDLLWFERFAGKPEKQTPFLFFSRNRANKDYRSAAVAFGSTNAVSFNFPNGLGIVAVGLFGNAGFTPKTGIQYIKQKKDFIFFGWAVADLKKRGSMDVFGLFRYQPGIKTPLKGFGQLELLTVYTPSSKVWNLTQRLRLGLKHRSWAAGMMADLNQTGAKGFSNTNNYGIFLRNEF